jgi:hypothetical protein
VRRKFDEVFKSNQSPVAAEAIRRIAWIYRIEGDARTWSAQDRLAIRQGQSRLHWDALHKWLQMERARVPDGSGIAAAIDYGLDRWKALSVFLDDGEVGVGRVETWRGGRRSGLSVGRPFRLAVPEYPRRSSVSTSPSSNRTCRFPASGSLPIHRAFAFERSRAGGSRRISPNFS